MTGRFDLQVILTHPPADSPPEILASITLQHNTRKAFHTGYFLINPLDATSYSDLDWYLEEFALWPYQGFAMRAGEIELQLVTIGRNLYKMVFGGSTVATYMVQAWQSHPNTLRQISIISDIPSVLSLPWELLHDQYTFLLLNTQNPIPIVRRLPDGSSARSQNSFTPPLRILLATATPDDEGFTDPHTIARGLLAEMQQQITSGAIALEFLRPPTLPALMQRLKNKQEPIHIFHFNGHGAFFQGQVMQGVLAFEDDQGKADHVTAQELATILKKSGVKLVLLTACESGMGRGDDPFSSVAAQLLQNGVSAVIAMSAMVLSDCTTHYAETFYRVLGTGASAIFAHACACKALYENPCRYLHLRYRNEGEKPVKLYDWWLPHFYQRRLFILQPEAPVEETPRSNLSTSPMNEAMPHEPLYGFTGRARELLTLERQLTQKKVVIIHGFSGIGKTALTRECADWLTHTQMYRKACFVSFENGGASALLLSSIGHFLEVYDGYYDPNNQEAALTRLASVIGNLPTLVIADNIETILSNGEIPLSMNTRTLLWDTLLKLARMGFGVLITTRDTIFDDDRLQEKNQVAFLSLQGLRPRDAYIFATHLIQKLGLDPAQYTYFEFSRFLAHLDYHPLAIQLVLPLLQERSLSNIQEEFVSLLPKFVDDTVIGHSKSLLTSLDYSVQRLQEEQQMLLPLLAVFENGADEDNFLAITKISQTVWNPLRTKLVQYALLTLEQTYPSFSTPFLHFHPLLTPYLRKTYDIAGSGLQQRYISYYQIVIGEMVIHDQRNPELVRALVLREFPNIKRAFHLLLTSDLASAIAIANSMAWFLTAFGRRRELQEIQQQITDAMATQRFHEVDELTEAEWLSELNLAQAEYEREDFQAASSRMQVLLDRVQAQPEETLLGKGSYVHCIALHLLARYLTAEGKPGQAEAFLHEALAIITPLIDEATDARPFIRQHAIVLTELGDTLRAQGQYTKAQQAYEERLKINEQLKDRRSQAVVYTQLGTLALLQREYDKAQSFYNRAFQLFQDLKERPMVATVLHQQGQVAELQEHWNSAEDYYRKSLKIEEELGRAEQAASTCYHLARITEQTRRYAEAEAWGRQALHYETTKNLSRARSLSLLARLLTAENQPGHTQDRLNEARKYAQEAFSIQETSEASSEIWDTLNIMAKFAEQDGQPEQAAMYRSQAREAFARFEGNRFFIDQKYGTFITTFVSVAKGTAEAKMEGEASLRQLEADGWQVTKAIKQIWEGERNLEFLTRNLSEQEALLVRCILEHLLS